MSVTDGDREKVVEIIKQALADEKWLPPQPYRLHVYRLAAALAEEREKARAPFLALAGQMEKLTPNLSGRQAWLHAVDQIRRTAEES